MVFIKLLFKKLNYTNNNIFGNLVFKSIPNQYNKIKAFKKKYFEMNLTKF